MRIVIFLALLLLPAIAQGQTGDCLIEGETARISGKVEHVEDDKAFHWTRTGYLIELLQPRCYATNGTDVPDKPVRWIQVVLNRDDPPPHAVGPFARPVDPRERRKQLEKWLKTKIGKYVAVMGQVHDTSLSIAVFGNPVLIVRSITECEIALATKDIEKC